MAADLLRCLVCTQTPDTAIRIAAEQELQHYSTQHGFGLALLEVSYISTSGGCELK